MASVAKRPDGKWRARYRDATGREHARHFTRKVDAQRWLDEVTASVVTGAYVDPHRSRVTVAAVAADWVASPSWAASTRARNRGILDRYVLPRWGGVPLDRIAHEDVQRWIGELSAGGLAGGSVRKVAGVLASVLDAAVRARRLAVNPARGVSLPRQALTRRRYLTAVQVEALADAADEWGDLVLVLAYTGLRFGEAAALRVRAVDLQRRRLLVESSVTDVDGQMVFSSPKDHQRRSVPFPAFLVDDFEGRLRGKDADALVFPSRAGTAVRLRNARRDWFDLAARVAGVEGLTPHELRHTAASLAVGAGASVLAVQRMLGHDKPSTTLDVYSDLFDADLDAVAARLGDARSAALADQVRTVDGDGLDTGEQPGL